MFVFLFLVCLFFLLVILRFFFSFPPFQMLITIIIIAIALTFIALIATIIWLLKVSGLFTSIRMKIAEPSFEFLTIVYKFQKGDYSQSADIFKDILNYSPSHSTIAIYYDNPEIVSSKKKSYR